MGQPAGLSQEKSSKERIEKLSFICFEKNINFYNSLVRRIHAENVFFVNDDVFNCAKHLPAEFGVSHKDVDCIISTLPCSFLNVNQLLPKAVLPLVKKEGFFIQYTHILSFLKGFRLNPLLRKYFAQISSDFVFLNIPPALIYTCRNLKETEEAVDNTA